MTEPWPCICTVDSYWVLNTAIRSYTRHVENLSPTQATAGQDAKVF